MYRHGVDVVQVVDCFDIKDGLTLPDAHKKKGKA